jgi:hypothetical protein
VTNAVGADRVGAAWTALRAFFAEGMPARERAAESFAASENEVRAAADVDRLILWLLGSATALRYSRRPEPMEVGLARARELVNVVGRAQGEIATVSHRTLVEGICRDLAWMVPSQAAAYVEQGLDYADRTGRLAKRAGRDEWLAQAGASRGDLLLEAATDRRSLRKALIAHEDARRRWPSRDPYGRAQAALGYARVLLALGEPARAELVVRETLVVFEAQHDRYHEAGALDLAARALFAQDQSAALDAQAAAIALYRALDCRWEMKRAETALG